MRKAFGVFANPLTWGELLYALIGLPLGLCGVIFVSIGLAVGVGTTITLIGLPVLAFMVFAARGFGATYRGLGRHLLGMTIETPPVTRRPGIVGYFTERTGWRALLFVVVQFPVAILDFSVAVTVYSAGLAGVTYWIWQRHLPYETYEGTQHRGAQILPGIFLDTPARIIATAIIGVVILAIAPRVVRGVLFLDRALIRGLLTPSAAAKRIQALEDTRAMAVDDSAASLRRIERDLHDGAQARLVSLAMSLGLAKEELDASTDPEDTLARVRDLVDSAHREAKGTIIDLRDLARGIHPPALDNGLPDALATLTARTAIPTTLHIDLPERPTPAIETIAYFCTAELLTNVVKHSGAHHASIDIRAVDDELFVRVGDDGAGGAALGRAGGSGLTGLTDRISTVDGRLDIDSPEGGPTLITIVIPQ